MTDREREIQSGRAHYAESLPVEYQPDITYLNLYHTVLKETADRLAAAVGQVTELVLAERGTNIVLVSLARAGTPIGILMRRWALSQHKLDLPHYTMSIVRGRGIDATALNYLSTHHNPARVVFVDGWTGKGAITQELSKAIADHNHRNGTGFTPDLAVLADPGHCVRTFGTRDDFLIASACLNSTVSGLVSRTVLNSRYINPSQFHGAKYYHELRSSDLSGQFLDTISSRFNTVAPRISHDKNQNRETTWSGLATVRRIQQQYGITSSNFVKPGIGETTRVLLRRLPWRIVVRDPDAPEHRHIRLLAQARNVPVAVDPELAYSCVGLIKEIRA
ncbi:ATP/GTP-binding protein [Mycolicibacterium sp. 018/SC-01/001]|nr:ATP/GTP-binding protein [Mycolicibacterium sp. 018/SC-01/001]